MKSNSLASRHTEKCRSIPLTTVACLCITQPAWMSPLSGTEGFRCRKHLSQKKPEFSAWTANHNENSGFFHGVRKVDDLIRVCKCDIGDETVNAVDARDLHEFLEIGKDFSTWIKARIEQYGFAQNVDFVLQEFAPQNGGAGNRGARVDYHLTLDMAKELAMVERNEKGKQARQYFIECERRAKRIAAFAALPDFTNPTIAARAWADERERGDLNEAALRETQQKLIAAEPKLKALETIAECQSGSMCITNAAKALQIRPKAFFRWLSEHHWIYRRAGGSCWLAYQNRIQSGVLEHKITTVSRSDGTEKVIEQVLITGKGLAALAELLTSLRSLETTSSN